MVEDPGLSSPEQPGPGSLVTTALGPFLCFSELVLIHQMGLRVQLCCTKSAPFCVLKTPGHRSRGSWGVAIRMVTGAVTDGCRSPGRQTLLRCPGDDWVPDWQFWRGWSLGSPSPSPWLRFWSPLVCGWLVAWLSLSLALLCLHPSRHALPSCLVVAGGSEPLAGKAGWAVGWGVVLQLGAQDLGKKEAPFHLQGPSRLFACPGQWHVPTQLGLCAHPSPWWPLPLHLYSGPGSFCCPSEAACAHEVCVCFGQWLGRLPSGQGVSGSWRTPNPRQPGWCGILLWAGCAWLCPPGIPWMLH